MKSYYTTNCSPRVFRISPAQPLKVIRLDGKREKKLAHPAHSNVKIDQEVIKPTFLSVTERLLIWGSSLLLLALGMLWDRLLRRNSLQTDAVRLRRSLERIGPSAIKIGQQLGVRADLVPQEYSDELMSLLDSVPPFPTELARRRIEEELGQPIETIFKDFDNEPIGSASIACVYKALLHTGEQVAVKVRRPGVARIMASDLKALSIICAAAESCGFITKGKSEPVVTEFRRMLLDELNFLIEARQTELFRTDAKKSNPYVTAPRVYHQLTTSRVLVTEFISGVFVKAILEAIQHGDQVFLNEIARQGYDLVKISQRMVNVFYWELFENTFFHADPHPSNVVIKPNNTLVFIDFGATGTITSKYRSDLLKFTRSFANNDIDGMVKYLIASVEPLPPLNIEHYTNEMYYAMREFLFTAKNENASWQERSSGRAMTAMAQISRKYNITMKADVLRYFRASFQHDSIIYRLNPQLDGRKEFKRYIAQRAKQSRKEFSKQLRKRAGGLQNSDVAAIRGLFSAVKEKIKDADDVISFISKRLLQLERLFQRRVSNAAKVIAWCLRMFQVALFGGIIFSLWTYANQHEQGNWIERTLDLWIHSLFGAETEGLSSRVPYIHERGWFWIMLTGLVILFASVRIIHIVLRPKSKLE